LELTNIVTMKSGLEVTRSLKLVPFESLGMVFYSPSTVLYIVSFPRYSEILAKIRNFFILPLPSVPPLGGLASKYCHTVQ